MAHKTRSLDRKAEPTTWLGQAEPLAAAFRAAPVSMFVSDFRQEDNPIIHVNDAFSALTGYDRAEAIGRNCRFLQGPETDPVAAARIGQALATGKGIEIELLNYRKDGTPFWNALALSPIRNGARRVAYFVGVQHDVSAAKRLEQELAGAVSALDRKAALLHEVDHRGKNNLQVISSLVLLKARRVSDEAARKALLTMGERIGALSTAHRLLAAEDEAACFDLREFVADLAGDALAAVDPERVALTIEVERVAVPASKAAPLALLINELLTNALAHAFPEERSGRVRVRAEPVEGAVRIVVEDDGVGLPDAPPNPEGFGRTLIDMLVRQLKGTLAYEDAAPGTRAVIVVPRKPEAG